MSSLRQLLSDRKRLALAGALSIAIVAGAVAIVLAVAGGDGPESSREQGAPRSGAETEAERSKQAGGDSAGARKRPEGSSQAGSTGTRKRPGGGDPGGARKLPRDFVKELRRRKIPVIELEPGNRPGLPGGLQGPQQIDPRTLQKLQQQQQK